MTSDHTAALARLEFDARIISNCMTQAAPIIASVFSRHQEPHYCVDIFYGTRLMGEVIVRFPVTKRPPGYGLVMDDLIYAFDDEGWYYTELFEAPDFVTRDYVLFSPPWSMDSEARQKVREMLSAQAGPPSIAF